MQSLIQLLDVFRASPSSRRGGPSSPAGSGNPLTATQVSLLTGTGIGLLTDLQILDGRADGLAGVRGALEFDSVVSLAACAVLAAWLWRRVEPDLPD
jgi:hypothetical protein